MGEIIEKREEGIILFLKENYLLIIILILAFLINFHYFSITKDQPLWWDEAVYMLKAKAIAFGTPEVGVNPGRAILDSFIYSFFLTLGFGEYFLRFFHLLMTVFTMGFIYYLTKTITKNKLIAFFVSFSLSVSWVIIYVTTRMFPDITGNLLWYVCMFLFWKGYAEKSEFVPKYFYWLGPFFVLAIYAREFNIVFAPLFALYIFFKEKLTLFKRKEFYRLLVLTILSALPFFLYYYNLLGNPLANWIFRFTTMPTAQATMEEGLPYGGMAFFKMMPDYFGWTIIVLLILGMIYLSKTFLGLDIIWKNKQTDLDKYFFILLWFLIPFLSIAFIVKLFDQRFFLMAYPAAFIIGGYFLNFSYDYLKKRMNKILAIVFIFLILFLVAYPNFNRASSLIDSKKDSYLQVKEAGLWIKDNSVPGDIIYGNSQPQLVYYSERAAYPSPENESDMINRLLIDKPKYLVISIFERHPPWIYSWPQKNQNLVIPVQAYSMNQQPVLIIYQVNYSDPKFGD